MLVLIVGPPKAGKSLLATHLCSQHSFTRVHLSQASPSPDALHFSSSSSFLDYATATWRETYVCTDLRSATKLSEFSKRPWCIILAVDGPVGVRFLRAVADAKANGSSPPTLEEFVAADDLAHHGPLPLSLLTNGTASLSLTEEDDELSQPLITPRKQQQHLGPNAEGRSPVPSPARSPTFTRDDPFTASTSPTLSPAEPLSTLLPLASLTLSNPHSTPSAFFATLPSLSQLSDLLRPQWDTYFMLLASLASLRSNCMKRRVGAVLVRERRVVSTGYNGTPRGVRNCGEGGCARCNSGGDGFAHPEGEGRKGTGTAAMGQGLDECLCLHAEENALLEAGRERVSGGGTEGAVLYCNTCPCLRCTVKIVQSGVREVIYSLSYSMDEASRRVLEEAGVSLRQMGLPGFPR